ncbi:MAG: hypothetical protein EP332_08555 [Bacteroidetes bacterium]|nr:MAG: hypothetical protein EP332_08555 [Bacteroidota bacterium]
MFNSWMLARVAGGYFSQVYLVELALMVWMIYTADHLMDARTIQHTASTPRHRFHQRHSVVMTVLLVLSAVLFLYLIPADTGAKLWRNALLLFALIVVYLASLIWARKRGFRYVYKELFIAVVYVAGLAIVPLSKADEPFTWLTGIYLVRLFCLAHVNLLLFSLLEYEVDLRDEHPSVLKWFGPAKVKGFIKGMLVLGPVLGLLALYLDPAHQTELLILSAMELVIILVYALRKYLVMGELYRVLGDGLFLLPGLLWIYETFQRL